MLISRQRINLFKIPTVISNVMFPGVGGHVKMQNCDRDESVCTSRDNIGDTSYIFLDS